MFRAHRQAGSLARGFVLAWAMLLQACGGGGDDGNDDGGESGSRARLSVETANITVAAEPGDNAPSSSVRLTILNPPKVTLYSCVENSTLGITGVTTLSNGLLPTQALISFRSPGRLSDGTYNDQVEIQVGTDTDCTEQIDGSPATIDIHYTVSGGRVVSIDRDTISIEADGQDPAPKSATVRVTLDEIAEGGFSVVTEQTANAVSHTTIHHISQAQQDIEVVFKAGDALPTGVVDDTMTIRICYFSTCEREVEGSPFTVSTQAKVKAHAEPGVTPMPYLSRVILPHDVVDAEFDKAANALVMVSRAPSDAIYVYDVATGLERSRLLPQPPMSVSIAPDGLTTAVGHDAHVSVLDLATIGQAGAPDPTLLDFSSDAFDIVLDGNGFVHVFPEDELLPYSIEIATNTATSVFSLVRPRARARLHPAGQWIYSADYHVPASDIRKLDISSGNATALYDSPYDGNFDVCGNLWFSEDGGTIYTACGNIFISSADQAQDMIHAGALELSPSEYEIGWNIRSLSASDADDEIALIEEDRYACDFWPGEAGPCYSHLALYGKQSLDRLTAYSVGLVTIDGLDFAQRGQFVFHDAANGRKYVIGRAVNSPDPLQSYYLSVVE